MDIDEAERRLRPDARLDVVAVAAREQRASRTPSLSVGAVQAGAVVGKAAIGLADVEGAVVAGESTSYRIGSITKTFTAAPVLGLVEDGVPDLDARVSQYLPGTVADTVPLRSLLAHIGGVPREVPVDMWESMTGPDRDELRAALADMTTIDQPGVRWHYSNLGYAVLGQVVEQAMSTPCPELIDTRLISPLRLTSTTWTRPSTAAVGYRRDPYVDTVHREPDMDQKTIGVGGQLWSTVTDMLTWGDALAGGAPDVVSPRVVEAMHTVQVMVDRTSWTSGWGLGLLLDRRGDRVTAGHTGAMPGFLSALSFDRKTRSVAVALSNATRGAAVGRVAADLVRDQIATAPAPPPPRWTPSAPTPAELNGVLGRWWSEADETVFSWHDGALHALLTSGSPASETRFEAVRADEYRAVAGRFNGETLSVVRSADGLVERLYWATYPFTRTPR